MFLSKANLFSWFQKLGSTGAASKKPVNKPEMDPHHNPVSKTGSPLFAWFLQNWAKSAESEPTQSDSPVKLVQTQAGKSGNPKTGDSPLLRLAHSALDHRNNLPDEPANEDVIPADKNGLEQAIRPDDVPGFDGGRNRRKLGLAPIFHANRPSLKQDTPILGNPSAIPLQGSHSAKTKDVAGPVSNQALTAKINAMIAPELRPQSEVLVHMSSHHAEKVIKIANPRLEQSENAVLALKGEKDPVPLPERKSLAPQTKAFVEEPGPKAPPLEFSNPPETVRRPLQLSGSPTKSAEIVQETLASAAETPAVQKSSKRSSGSQTGPSTPEPFVKTTGSARPTVNNRPESVNVEPNPTSRAAEPEPGNRLGSEAPKASLKGATPTSISTATKTVGPNIMETVSSKNPASESVAKEPVVPMGWSEKVVSTANTPAPGAAPTLSNQLQSGVFEAIQQSPKQLVLKLQPDHLGELTIKIGLERERVHAQIGCQNDTVAAMIHDSKSDLDNALKQRGFQLNQFDIHQQGQNSGQSGQHPSGHPSWQRNGSAAQTATAPTAPTHAPGVETPNPARPLYVPGGPLNLLV